MPDLLDVREAIAEKLRAITGWQVNTYMEANPSPPSVHIFPGEIIWDEANARGSDTWELTVQVFVSNNVSDRNAQRLLDEFLAPSGARSVKAALEEERPGACTLGGLVQDLAVTRTSGYVPFALPSGGEVLGADFTVQIYASGV